MTRPLGTFGFCLGVAGILSLSFAKANDEPVAAPEWPKVPGAAFAFRNARVTTPFVAFDVKGRELLTFECAPRGRGLFGRFDELVCDGGSFVARDAGPWIGSQVAKSGAFTIEAMLTPAEKSPNSSGVVLAYADDRGEDLSLLQDKDGLSLKPRGGQPIPIFAVAGGKTVNVVITCDKQTWTAYRDGKSIRSGSLPAESTGWSQRQIVLGASWSGAEAWRGRMEGVAVFPRALTVDEVAKEAAASAALVAGRKPATTIQFRGTLVRQAKTADLTSIRPYTRSMTLAEYKVDQVLAGEWKQPTIKVLHWMIMDGKRLPIADRRPGAMVELSVQPLGEHLQLESCRRDDELDEEIHLDQFYCESQ